jgi:hypothetical protein
MKTKLEIIQETQDAYPHTLCRAVDEHRRQGVSACYYIDLLSARNGGRHNNGAMCAVGRCMIAPEEAQGSSVKFIWEENGSLDHFLKEEYRGHEINFWIELQRFHDNGENFEDGGLSVAGLGYLSELRTKWAS